MAENLTSRFRVIKPLSYEKSNQVHKYSCVNCRNSKRKCTKDLTGCFNCVRLGKDCVYNERKSKTGIIEDLASENVFQMKGGKEGFIRSIPDQEDAGHEPSFLLHTLGFSQFILNKTKHLTVPLISKNICRNFVDAFFKHNHRSYPLICESAFYEGFDKLEYINNKITGYHEFEIFMIMAIGCTALSRVGLLEQEDNYSKYFSYNSIRYLCQGIETSKLELIKMLMLLCIYSLFEPRGLDSWNLFGLISRSSLVLGLNRCHTNDNNLDDEMKVRLFWSIHNMDRLLSVSLGRPLSIDDYDIDVSFPKALPNEDAFTYKTIIAIISLRKIEGNIIKKLYTCRALELYQPDEVDNIKLELDEWLRIHKPNNDDKHKFFSFHGSNAWYLTRYHHDLMLLYQPSYLIPHPDSQRLNILGEYCVKTLADTHNLFKANLLPLNWITLYRFLTACSTTLHCLCNNSIDIYKSETEIRLSIEILDAFSENWVFASKCSKVFQNIVDNILEISLTARSEEVSIVKELSSELLGASSAYHEILNANSIDMAFTSMFYQDLMMN